MGPNPKVFKGIDINTNMPTNSSILGLLQRPTSEKFTFSEVGL
ncbi:hypothetical protein DSBG_4494 [Desulfosporosinus sp. BG]|nr:hypothetical protein DSBG_4494 [Desulfosporosinus sp. BG]